MSAFDGPVLAAAVLLLVAGAMKIVRPRPTVGALRSVGVSIRGYAARALGAVELVVGTTALLVGGRVVDALVAVVYAGFFGFVLVALRRGGAVSSCGCFGRDDTPPTRGHLVITGLAAATALAAALTGGHDGLARLPGGLEAVAVVGFAALTSWLAWLALAVLPRLHVASGR